MSVFRNICVIFTLFVAILATGSYLFASSSTPTRMTVNVFHDKNNNGEKNSNEPWLEGISITFDHTLVDLFFDGKVDELRPENNDTHFTKTTDVNGFLQFDTQLGFLYAKVSYPEKFSYIEQRTRKFHFRYA